MENIREYMEQNQAATEDFARRRISLTSQVRPLSQASKACLVGVSNTDKVLHGRQHQHVSVPEHCSSQAAPAAAQAAKLKHQLSYEQRRNLKKDAEAAEADLRKLQDNLERLQSQADEAAQASAALEQELSAEVGIPFVTPCVFDPM